jgi:hypothetical protein
MNPIRVLAAAVAVITLPGGAAAVVPAHAERTQGGLGGTAHVSGYVTD